MATHDMRLSATLPAAPSTQRATPVRIDAFQNSIAYGAGNCVIIRSLAAEKASASVLVCSLHKAPVTAVRFSPNGAFVASGDRNGTLIIFANKAGTLEKFSSPLLQGAVRDIAWTGDGERLVVVGEGKNVFGVAISNTGNAIGAINGHTRAIRSCDLRRERPFRAFTGSQDSFVGFYEGVPFTFKANTPGHTNVVTCVRYSPASNEVASCSSSAEIIIMDGTTGARLRSIPSHHTGTLYGLSWSPDGKHLATASADKHVNIISAADGALVRRVCLGDGINDMQQGVVWTESAGIAAVSLGGAVTTLESHTGAITQTLHGHQGRVLLLHVCAATGDLLSLSAEGRLLRWSGAAQWLRNAVVPLPSSCEVVNAATVHQGKVLYMVAGNTILAYQVKDATLTKDSVRVISSTAGGFAPAVAVTEQGSKVVLVTRNKLKVIDTSGNTCAEEALPPSFNASVVAAARSSAGGEDVVVVGGDRLVRVYKIDAAGIPKATGVELSGRHTGTVSCVAAAAAAATADKASHIVASADGTSRSIVVWSASTGEVTVQRPMCHHTSAVTSMAFDGECGGRLLSGGLDCTLLAWDLGTGARTMEDATHRGGITAVAWGRTGGKEALSAGGDCCIKHWMW